MDRSIGSSENARTAREVVLVDPATGATITPLGKLSGPGTGAQSNIDDTVSDTSLLASNPNRKGACFFNGSTSILYLLLANGTASVTSYSVQIGPGGYYELPVCQGGVYTGAIKGVWSADASGACRVTEFS